MMLTPPNSESELIERAQQLAGLTLAQLAARFNLPVPTDLRREKGWIGQLLEQALGTTAGTLPKPDFMELGIELKTIPIDRCGKPLESTFVSTIHLLGVSRLTWESSYVYQKLKRVLWVPILAEKHLSIADRQIGTPFLWSPDTEQMAALRQDWQELTDMIALGELEKITARHGRYLQIRPKGANAKALVTGINENGERIKTLPRGFYLRALFTKTLLQDYF